MKAKKPAKKDSDKLKIKISGSPRQVKSAVKALAKGKK